MTAEVEKLMKALDITEEEALELIAEDEKVDKMTIKQTTDDLTAEQKSVVKKMKNTTRAVDAFGKKREINRQPDEVKRMFVEEIFKMVEGIEGTEEVNIANVEREVDFKYGGKDYYITFSFRRGPHKK